MKLALIGDLHGNWPATQAMERELTAQGVDEIWFLGDAVGKGPSNALTCDWVRANCTRFVGGNWDYGIGGKEFDADTYFWNQLGDERLNWLNNLPREMEATISGIRFRLFHGRPVMPLMQGGDDSDTLETAFLREDGENYGGVIFADSHRPFLRTLNAGYILNTGSVGNNMGVPRAHGLLVQGVMDSKEPASLSFTHLCVPYDTAAAVALADEELPFREAYIT